jgi:hypothetical protein
MAVRHLLIGSKVLVTEGNAIFGLRACQKMYTFSGTNTAHLPNRAYDAI